MNRRILAPAPLFLLLLLLLSGSALLAQPGIFTADGEQFLLGGKPFQIISGEMHYLRIPPEYWRDRLEKARAMGLNTVATYVFWNSHEPQPDSFNFSGGADLAKFIRTAQDVGLYVILRPGPYACAEWEFGGYPSWLLKSPPVTVRGTDERYLAACGRYFTRLGKELAGLQITRGGPILMVQVENEYGSFGADTVYMGRVRDMIRSAGFDVPLFTADGPSQMPRGSLPDVLPAINGATGQDIFDTIRKFRPHGPFFVAEFYPGWLDHWGEAHAKVDAAGSAAELDWMLAHGVSVNFYMFHGGTNFGFMNGANYGGRFQPQPTSYDYDAPLDEAGRPTKKYYVFRDVIAKYLPAGTVLPPVPPALPSIEIPAVTMRRSGSIFLALPPGVQSERPLSMEDIGQSYGYTLYFTRFSKPGKRTLAIRDLRDYGIVYVNGVRVASLDRRHKMNSVELDLRTPTTALGILVENGGRINYGKELLDNRKGIVGKVFWGEDELTHWEIFPIEDLPAPGSFPRSITGEPTVGGEPVLYAGTFMLDRAGDSYLDMRAWAKGAVWVNGHNLGRYWYIGPQQTLYLPGAWLKAGENEIKVLELEGMPHEGVVRGLKEPVLDELEPDKLAPPPPKRAVRAVRLRPEDMVRAGSFVPGDEEQERTIAAVSARYVCIESKSSLAGDPFASIAELNILDPAGKALPRAGWTVYSVDSEELVAEDGRAENAFDGDRTTIWHTQWGSAKPPHPHALVIDLGADAAIGGFRYLPRPGGSPGKIKDFCFYVRHEPFEPAE
jgi:beta-galactosidase